SRAMDAAGRAWIALPSSSTTPLSGRWKPVTRLKKVLLPEPFGPITPTISPGQTEIAWPFSAVSPRNDLVRPRVASSGVPVRPAGAFVGAAGAAGVAPVGDAPGMMGGFLG